MKKFVIVTAVLVSACDHAPPPSVGAPPPAAYAQDASGPVLHQNQTPASQPVVSIYVEPPPYQPPPVRVAWAPPPMLVETPPPIPYDGAIWIGGYWVWEGNWVWAHGRWAAPPKPGYGWVNPYYENRHGSVVFVDGFWGAPGIAFVAPSAKANIAFAAVAAGVIAGLRPIGPEGVFVPPPPGSRRGLIVPAPIGTAPAVVTGAPPIIREGMHINVSRHNSTTVNVINTRTVTTLTNINNVTIFAPASATANGQAVNTSVPARAHLAAAMPPLVKAFAPEPASANPVPAHVPGRPPIVLPPAQKIYLEVTPSSARTERPSLPVTAPMPALLLSAPKAWTHTSIQDQGKPNQPKPNVALSARAPLGQQERRADSNTVSLAPATPVAHPKATPLALNIKPDKAADSLQKKQGSKRASDQTAPMPPPTAIGAANTKQNRPNDAPQSKKQEKKKTMEENK